MKHYWFYNPNTLKETYLPKKPDNEWIKGRLPYQYWSEERKQSYREKHSKPLNLSEESRMVKSEKARKNMKGRVWYTNGIENVALLPGQDVPEGFYKGMVNKTNGGCYKGCHWIINEEGKREWQKK